MFNSRTYLDGSKIASLQKLEVMRSVGEVLLKIGLVVADHHELVIQLSFH